MNLLIIIVIIFLLIRIFFHFWNYWNRRQFEWNTHDGKCWAVITGSTDGIGYEFARQLALKGYNIMMISRNEEKLARKRQMILNECQNKSIEIRTLVIDFKHTNYTEKLKQFLDTDTNDITVLVNNVGRVPASNQFNYSHEESLDIHLELINVNNVSAIQMTDLILPSMISKRNGLIINVSSFASIHPIPFFSVYGATKSFLTHYSRSLFAEIERFNVLVFLLTPASVCTNLYRQETPTLFAPDARTYVEKALKTINWTQPEDYGYWPHTYASYLFFTIEWIFGWRIKTKIIRHIVRNSAADESANVRNLIHNLLLRRRD